MQTNKPKARSLVTWSSSPQTLRITSVKACSTWSWRSSTSLSVLIAPGLGVRADGQPIVGADLLLSLLQVSCFLNSLNIGWRLIYVEYYRLSWLLVFRCLLSLKVTLEIASVLPLNSLYIIPLAAKFQNHVTRPINLLHQELLVNKTTNIQFLNQLCYYQLFNAING